MSDYAAMADDELNREIALRRGWTGLTTATSYEEFVTGDGGYVDVLVGHLAHPDEFDFVPRWATDLNAAAELLKEMPYGEVSYDGDYGKFTHLVVVDTDRWGENTYASTDNERLSRCFSENYMMWTDAHPTAAMQSKAPTS